MPSAQVTGESQISSQEVLRSHAIRHEELESQSRVQPPVSRQLISHEEPAWHVMSHVVSPSQE